MKKIEASYPLVEVLWLDAGLESIQMDAEQAIALTGLKRKNAGYCLVNNKEKVVLCFGIIADGEHGKTVYDQTLVIPKGIVIDIRPVKTE